MVRPLLLLVALAALLVVCSADAVAQSGGGIRGSAAGAETVGTEGSPSASLVSAAAAVASNLIKVWPHPAAQVWHAANEIRRKLQDELESAPDNLGEVCSSDSLETDAGVAACTEACAPAQCCQDGIGQDGCGFANCLTYADCLALASIFGVDVPPEAEGLLDGGGGEDGEPAEDGGGMNTSGDTNTTDTDGDETTGDGTFTNPEDGSILGNLGDAADTLKDTFQKAMDDPSSLSTGAKVGIGIGCFVLVMMLVCLIKCCCCRKKA